MINLYGDAFPLGELIAKKYATVFKNGQPITPNFDFTAFINPGSCQFFHA